MPGTFSRKRGWNGWGAPRGLNYLPAWRVEHAGNIYVVDQVNCTIRKVTPTGALTTLAGLAGSSGSVDGTGSAARFNLGFLSGITVDSACNLYVADSGNNTIRKVTPVWDKLASVTTLAGLRAFLQCGTTGNTRDSIILPGVAVDSTGNVFVADLYNYTIRKVTSGGSGDDIGRTGGVSGTNDGTGSAARFNQSWKCCVDNADTAYMSRTHTRRSGSDVGGSSDDVGRNWRIAVAARMGPISTARFSNPAGITVG